MGTLQSPALFSEPATLIQTSNGERSYSISYASDILSLSDTLAQPVVIQLGESGQADSEDGTVNSGLLQKVQRNESAVVQIWVILTQRSDLDSDIFPTADELVPQLGVILHTQLNLCCAKSGHIPGGALAR